jgi:hypothetical protein
VALIISNTGQEVRWTGRGGQPLYGDCSAAAMAPLWRDQPSIFLSPGNAGSPAALRGSEIAFARRGSSPRRLGRLQGRGAVARTTRFRFRTATTRLTARRVLCRGRQVDSRRHPPETTHPARDQHPGNFDSAMREAR